MKFLIELGGRCCWPKQRPKLCSIFLSFIGLWAKIWHRNKTTYSKLNPVQTLQSSRFKSMTCPKEENLLRFKLNSTETSNDCAQKLGNDVCRRLVWFWIDCNQSLQPNQWQMKCNLLQERVSAQIRIKQHKDFRWQRAKAWSRILNHYPKSAAQSVANEMLNVKVIWWPASIIIAGHWFENLQINGGFEDFFEQFVFVNNHLLRYWPIIHKSISKVFQLQSMPNVIKCID